MRPCVTVKNGMPNTRDVKKSTKEYVHDGIWLEAIFYVWLEMWIKIDEWHCFPKGENENIYNLHYMVILNYNFDIDYALY